MKLPYLLSALIIVSSLCTALFADTATNAYGIKIRMGGRFDNVRKCVASKPGTKGGIAADISFFSEIPLRENALLHVDIPVMRPVLFAFAFKMLQFEPSVACIFKNVTSTDKNHFAYGPMLGFSLHYGPDYTYDSKKNSEKNAFFALGPTIGVYTGYKAVNNEGVSKFAIGVSPYVTPLFSISDTQKRKGIIIGGLADATYYFKTRK